MTTWTLPDILRPIRHNLSPSTSPLSRKAVHHCSTLRSVFPGRQSYRMEQSCQKAMPQQQLPCKQWERPPRNSSHNYSRLHCLITLAQIAEGKKLVEPAEVSIEDLFWSVFLGSRILWSSWWWSLGVYWVLSQPTWNFTLDYTHFCELQQQNERLLALQVIFQTTKPTYN